MVRVGSRTSKPSKRSRRTPTRAGSSYLFALASGGSLPSFLDELARDRALDDETKGQLAEIASDRMFLLAVGEYLRRTRRIH